MTDILRLVTDFWWAVPLAGAALVAYRFLGWRGLLAAITLGAAGGLYTKGKRDEREALERKAQAARSEAIKEKGRIRNEINSADPSSNRDRLKRWGLPDNEPRD
jgi:hypothetical protein